MSETRRPRVAASVKQRLLNLARESGQDFQALLTRYALERLLYRLSRSRHRDRLVLKGAFLFLAWQDDSERPTRDLDLLSSGEPDVRQLETVFSEIVAVEVQEDGLDFRADTIRGESIRRGDPWQGVRLRFLAMLGKARIPLQVDVGFGDVVEPGPVEVEFPALLDHPPPTIKAYPVEAVVSEKTEALVRLGLANSRLKDFFDLWRIASIRTLDGATLSRALGSTFAKRRTEIPAEDPAALTSEFADDEGRRRQWRALVERYGAAGSAPDLPSVLAFLRGFLAPVLGAARERVALHAAWSPERGWLQNARGVTPQR